MNSYPPELLAQLAPVMFIAGLDVPPSLVQQGPPRAPGSIPPSPAPVTTPTPTTPPPTPPKPQDPFHVLILRLRDALTSQRKVAIWQPEKSKTFQVVLVDKDVRFPPRKLIAPDDPQYSSAHSPLSPLSPSSPLYPDGIIAPIWIRKHTTLVPSVFVLFLRIFEYPMQLQKSPLEVVDNEKEKEREREAEERRRDTELAAEIALRKQATNERNIKLTVVLLASRKMLDDPTLDARLTYIRRHSGLDSRAALFVLSPVSPSELGEFVKSLTQALYDPAIEYYTAHSKRVRRKRNKHANSASPYPNPPIGNMARPLRPEGWTVRYEYKMACFAEFRGEDEVALKHYQDAYETLVIMFGSPIILPPRTKRWAEAKVLADTINIKIVKLYLYNNEHSLALSHHTTHIRKSSDFSRGWGIGEETFEYWSWTARQHRILAELLEQGTRSTLTIPVHRPQITSSSSGLVTSQIMNPSGQRVSRMGTGNVVGGGIGIGLDVDPRAAGINPSHALQHPGYYYYAAARCTELRRMKFQAILAAEQRGKPINLSPGFTNEKRVDHNASILELYTKSYELFKRYNPGDPSNQGQGRLTLWIAYRIAQTHCDSGKYEMAIRFFERIAKTYRREQWRSMLRPLLSTWYACAKRLGDVELGIQLLLEMIGHDTPDVDEPNALEEDLIAVLQSTVPASADEPFLVDLWEAQPILDTNVVFWSAEVQVREPVAFQISLTAPSFVSISSLPFSALKIYFNDENASPTVICHSHSEDDDRENIQLISVGSVSSGEEGSHEANLRWNRGSTLVITGTMSSDTPILLKVVKIMAVLELNTWKVEIPLRPCKNRRGMPPVGKWLSSVDPPKFTSVKREGYSSAIVKHRPHHLAISISHAAPAYLDENYRIVLEVTNMDDKDLDVTFDILLQPTEIDGAVNYITVDGEQSSSLIKGVQCGTLKPGISIVKTLLLLSTGAAGERVLDISTQSRPPEFCVATSSTDTNFQLQQGSDVTEKLRTIVVPTLDVFTTTQDVVYQHDLGRWSSITELESYEEDWHDGTRGCQALVETVVKFVGPWSVMVEGIGFEEDDNVHSRVLHSSLDEDDENLFPGEFLPGDELNMFTRLSVSIYEQSKVPTPGFYLIQWRRILQLGEQGELSATRIAIPPLEPPQEAVVALLDLPPVARLHVPINVTISLRNYHPTLSANILCQLETENLDTFVVSGLRSGKLPILLPGAEENVKWRVIPIECGHITLPKIKIMNVRKVVGPAQSSTNLDEQGDVVETIDVRRDWKRTNKGVDVRDDNMKGPMSILVLP